MKFLFDTNLIIPAEPTSHADEEPGTALVAELIGLIGKGQHQAYVHPDSLRELQGDKNPKRRELRRKLIAKYQRLPAPPKISDEQYHVLGRPRPGSNDEVDYLLLAAVVADAVNYLITDDRKLHKRAARLCVGDRVLFLADAAAMVRGLFHRIPPSPPSVVPARCHEISEEDPIFNSLRREYKGFDDWFRRCKLAHRRAWTIRAQNGELAGLCIVKDEEKTDHGLTGKILKLCTFKIAFSARGFRYGELLLKTVFDYAFANQYEVAYVTIFERHADLIELLVDFGFEEQQDETNSGEKVLQKPLRPSAKDREALAPLGFHVKFGPRHVKIEGVPAFIIPIRPKFHATLFPEIEAQASLLPSSPCGNCISKAYLCHASTRQIEPGSPLLFYRSGGSMVVTCAGVAEDTLVADDPDRIAGFVGKRTVYSYEHIVGMCRKDVLAIRFRQAKAFHPPIKLDALIAAGVVSVPPQSVAKVREKGLTWLQETIGS